MIINELMNSNEDNRSGHNYVSSVSDFTPISDRSCLGRISATPLKMAELAETRLTFPMLLPMLLNYFLQILWARRIIGREVTNTPGPIHIALT